MLIIPNIIDDSVPIGKDDSENVEIEKFGEPQEKNFDIPYHVEIMEKLNGLDLESARKTSGTGFYYLMGDVARLHSAILAYARDFMVDRGFTYCIPPFMIHGDVVTGVMSFAEMENMMYKIAGELPEITSGIRMQTREFDSTCFRHLPPSFYERIGKIDCFCLKDGKRQHFLIVRHFKCCQTNIQSVERTAAHQSDYPVCCRHAIPFPVKVQLFKRK